MMRRLILLERSASSSLVYGSFRAPIAFDMPNPPQALGLLRISGFSIFLLSQSIVNVIKIGCLESRIELHEGRIDNCPNPLQYNKSVHRF